jgi:NAD dependent epimerase/dehydratase family enzyme
MKIIIAGGSGFLGKILTAHWRSYGHEIIVFTREAQKKTKISGTGIGTQRH